MANERQVEMWWRCSSCQHRNLGRHGVCQACNNPKDGSEAWALPEDPAAAPSVTDPKLLAIAMGGADWRCTFCGSDQRAADGACRQCGARPPVTRPRSAAPAKAPAKGGIGCLRGCGLFVLLLALAGVGAGLVLREANRGFTDVDVVVDAIAWRNTATLERRQLVEEQGFREQVPADALALKPDGTRVHHVVQVPDGWADETYQEEVPDGTRTREVRETVADGDDVSTRTERVRCGEDCSPGRETCREVCSPNGNGFATCRTTCTPGPRLCEPRWCDETKTTRTPKTRTQTRTVTEPATRTVERTRRVRTYRSEDRRAPFFTWKAWRWVSVDTLVERGTTPAMRWPVSRGSDERVTGEQSVIEVRFRRAFPWPFGVQRWRWQAERLDGFAPGAPHRLRVRGDAVLSVDPSE